MPGDYGTGMIPKKDLLHVNPKQGLPDAIEIIKVAHVSGDTSIIILKSYDQKREAFQGTEMDLIWLDEEPPEDIYTECLLRTMTTNGLIMLSFTPLQGWTHVVNSYLKEEEDNTKWFVTIPWDDAPHLTAAQKKELLNSIPLHQRDARTKGIPSIGSGQIYPFKEEDIVYEDFAIPVHWPKAYGMDVGWNWTAAVWIAKDRDTDTIYIYNCYKVGETKPAIHAQAIKARGEWIKGVIDYAGTDQSDGTRIMTLYQTLGLNVLPANKTVETGLFMVEQRLATGTLRIAKSCRDWFNEQLLYRRNDKGQIVKEHDHLMDATRYIIMKAEDALSTGIIKQFNIKDQYSHVNPFVQDNWMA
jgi:phage terminase large subunit-like protein/sarcosine oxidase delta subunit